MGGFSLDHDKWMSQLMIKCAPAEALEHELAERAAAADGGTDPEPAPTSGLS
jgi:hypothetical protein